MYEQFVKRIIWVRNNEIINLYHNEKKPSAKSIVLALLKDKKVRKKNYEK